jgi:hypothetical protein
MKRQPGPGPVPQQGNQMPAEDQGMTLLADAIDNLNSQVETLVKNQEYMITVQERTADLLQRQADAIEMVMDHLNMSPDMAPQTPAFENHYISSQEPEVEGTVEELLKAELEAEQKMAKQTAPKPAKPVLRKRRKVVAPKAPVQQMPPSSQGKKSWISSTQ